MEGIAARDGSTTAWGNSVVVTATGQEGVHRHSRASRRASTPRQPTPRWPDGQPRLGPPPGQIMGYWAFPSATTLVEQGVERSSRRARHVAQPRGYRQGGAVSALGQGPLRIAPAELPERRSDVHLLQAAVGPAASFSFPTACNFWRNGTSSGSGSCSAPAIRTGTSSIRTDVPSRRSPRKMRTILCTGAGRSASGKGIRSSSNTDGFNDSFWFSNGGLPHTQQLRLIERFSRPDLNTLQV